MAISHKDIIDASPGLMMADLEGEAVLLDTQSGRYYGLNEVGTKIWSMACESSSVGDILRALHGSYDVSDVELERDILAFLEQMSAHRLVSISCVDV